jgi:hypothetical protein
LQNIKTFEKNHSNHTIVTLEYSELSDDYKLKKMEANDGESEKDSSKTE